MVASALSLIVVQRLARKNCSECLVEDDTATNEALLQIGFSDEELSTFKPKKGGQIAQTVKAKAIVCFTLRGSTVRRASQERATVPVLAITPFKETARQLVMSWGVYPDLPRSGKIIVFLCFTM